MRRREKVLGAIHLFIKVGDESVRGQDPNRAKHGWSAATGESYTPLISSQTISQMGRTHSHCVCFRYICPNCT